MKHTMLTAAMLPLVAMFVAPVFGWADNVKKPQAAKDVPQVQKFKPIVKHDGPDLAAVNIFGSFTGDPTMGTAKFIMIGVVRNVGNKPMDGYRYAQLFYKKPGGSWQHAATRIITYLKVGGTVEVHTQGLLNSQQQPGTQWMLRINKGDYNPGNDVYHAKPTPTPVIK